MRKVAGPDKEDLVRLGGRPYVTARVEYLLDNLIEGRENHLRPMTESFK